MVFDTDVLAALGRVVVDAAGLETALAVFAGERLALDARDTMGRPGMALKAARRALHDVEAEFKPAYEAAFCEAESLLLRRHEFIHAIWSDASEDNLSGITVIHMRTFRKVDVSVQILDTFSQSLRDCRSKVIRLLAAEINHRPVTDVIL
ncbi:hypothetical protein [Amycolatopsis sp. WGS_07]|uniref:hypothetical protein n=1 Tax=Amycolatopsis sp. WGS_07 TaxID=3076764 RepID=UPI003873AA68